MTSDGTVIPLRQPDTIDDSPTAVLRNGARRLLAQASVVRGSGNETCAREA